jgi:hypothetical protein
MFKRLFCILAVLAIAGSANASLIAYYDFGTSSASTANQGTAGSAADGVLINGAQIVDIDTTAGGVEWALQLNNTTGSGLADCQYMNITNGDDTWYDTVMPYGTGARSFAAWIRMEPDTTQTFSSFISKGRETTLQLGCGFPSSSITDHVTFSYHKGIASWSPLKSTVGTMSDEYWHHVVATIDGEDYKKASLYINGVLHDSLQSWHPLYQNDLDLLIGAEPNRTGFQFGWNGMIDDVRIYDEHLDDFGVMDLFLSTHTVCYGGSVLTSPRMDSVEITGPEEVAEDGQGQYRAAACINSIMQPDCNYLDVTDYVSWWLEPETDADIDESGLLTVGNIDAGEIISIYAECTLGGVTKVGEMEVNLCGSADLNNDDKIDLRDYAILAWQWLEAPGAPSADLSPYCSGDGIVDVNDLGMLVDGWP